MNNMADKYDYGFNYNEDNNLRINSCGAYKQVAYNPEIKIFCEVNNCILRMVKTSIKTKFEILINGELINSYPSEKIAIDFFVDFAEITKGKYKKLRTA